MAELPDMQYAEVVDAGAGWTKVRTADGQVVTIEGNRNWRNNNPGNIEYGDFAKSMGAIGTDGRFAVFPSYEAGREAKSSLIFESPNYKNLSLADAINRYAPPFENNTQSYLDTVAAAAGVAPGTPMNQIPPEKRADILDAMQRVEGWKIGTINGAAAPAPVRTAQVPLPRPRPDQPTAPPIMAYMAPGGGRLPVIGPTGASAALNAINAASPQGQRPLQMSYVGQDARRPGASRLPAIGPAGGPALNTASASARGQSPSWWSNPLGSARTALGGAGIGGLVSPTTQRAMGTALLSTPAGRGMVLRTVLNGGAPAAAPAQSLAQVQAQPGFNQANHNMNQLTAMAAGQSSFSGSDGGLQPVNALNGKPRNTYG